MTAQPGNSGKMHIRKDQPAPRASYEKSCLSLRNYFGMTMEDREIFQEWRTLGRGQEIEGTPPSGRRDHHGDPTDSMLSAAPTN